jgi:hypothetical protein
VESDLGIISTRSAPRAPHEIGNGRLKVNNFRVNVVLNERQAQHEIILKWCRFLPYLEQNWIAK